MFTYIKKHWIIASLILLVSASVVIYFLKPKTKVAGDFITAHKADVVKEVDATGRVEPAEKVQLNPESNGKVTKVNAKVGDKVKAGTVLVQIDDQDLQIQLAKQNLEVQRAELALEKAQRSNKPSQVTSDNDLARAFESKFNAESDYKESIDAGYNSVSDAFLDLPDVTSSLKAILDHDYLSSNSIRISYGNTALDYLNSAESDYYSADDSLDQLTKTFRLVTRQSDDTTVKSLIIDTYNLAKELSDALKSTQNLLDYLEDHTSGVTPSYLTTDQATIHTLTETLNGHVSALLSAKNNLTKYEQAITDAKRVINEKSASHQDLNQDDALAVTTAEINLAQAKLGVSAIQVDIDKHSVKAPMDGVVTDVSIKVGELALSSIPVVSVISATDYQVTTNVPEVDVASIKVGMPAKVELDSTNLPTPFAMVVTSIDPAEKMLDGVAVYEVVLQFVKFEDSIKSGFTADITIEGERHNDVLVVPQRAVITKGETKFVKVKSGEGTIDKQVTTGLRGSSGEIEVTSGLDDGDQVLVFTETK